MDLYSKKRSKGLSWTAAIILILLTAFIAGGAAFFWQASSLNNAYSQNKALNDELSNLKRDKDNLQNEKSQLEKDLQTFKDQISQDIPKGQRETIQSISDQILHKLKDKDMSALAELVHPEKGVRFTPYSYVDVNKDVKIASSEFAGLMNETTKRLWGAFDGSGEPIDMIFSEYYKKFVYDVNFLEAPQIIFNQAVQRGNSLVNMKEAYPDALFIEYHFPGFEAQYQGMDWRSLRLAFEEKDGKWYLVGIIHDQWTI